MARKTNKYRFTGKGTAKAAKAPAAPVKAPKYYPADDVPYPLTRNFTPKSAKLRASITPGSVLILLSGRHRGKRVVFLQQMPSGLLLVTGPYKVNGVPMRRVNQRYVIATSAKVDVSGVSVPATVTDAFFKRPAAAAAAGEMFAEGETAVVITTERKAMQKAMDASIIKGMDATMKKYLNARFSLSKGDAPHNMKF